MTTTLAKFSFAPRHRRALSAALALLVLVPLMTLGNAGAANAWSCGTAPASSLDYWDPSGPQTISQNYSCGSHSGTDYARGATAWRFGAVQAGTVIAVNNTVNSCHGRYVVIAHPDGIKTAYAHLSSISVTLNQQVSKGQIIAYAGSSGIASASCPISGVHLHLSMTTNWTGWSTSTFFDPAAFLATH